MIINITNTSNFFQVRQSILSDIENNNPIDQIKFSHPSGLNVTMATAVCFLLTDSRSANPRLKTAKEKKMFFKQLTQSTSLTTQQQKQIAKICSNCLKTESFKPNQAEDEFEALSSIELGTISPLLQPGEMLHSPEPHQPQRELSKHNFKEMYGDEDIPRY
mgnify:CR=1 FL=1